MAQLNRKAVRPKPITVINSEGNEMYKDRPDRSFILQGYSLKLRHSFYKTYDDRLKNFYQTAKLLYAKEPEFYMAAIKHLKDSGMKLSPAMALAAIEFETIKGYQKPFGFIKLAKYVFTRPDIIANYLTFLILLGYTSIKVVSKDSARAIRESIEAMTHFTLTKRMMRKRSIKLADIIKIFRPIPSSEERSKLYKGIIENRVRLQAKQSIVQTLSDVTTTKEQKKEIITDLIATAPINEIIRNLSQYAVGMTQSVFAKLSSRFSGLDISSAYQINPLDLIVPQDNFDLRLTVMLDDVLEKYLKNLNKVDLGRVGVLIDVSGSMASEYASRIMPDSGIYKAFKLLSLIRGMYGFSFVRFFSNHLIEIPQVETAIKNKSRPNEVFGIMGTLLKIKDPGIWHGTNMQQSIVETLQTNECDTLIVFTDEFGNIGNNIEAYNLYVRKYTTVSDEAGGKKLIIINVDFTGDTAIDPIRNSSPNVMLLAGITAKIFEYIEFLHGFETFKKRLIKDYKDWSGLK